ncbi:hypothetical protein [Desulfotalea psychrophila]|nr:hypothetical protein [Desulfotalea psychrophila]
MKKIYRLVSKSHCDAVLRTRKIPQSDCWQVSMETKRTQIDDEQGQTAEGDSIYNPEEVMALLGNNELQHGQEAQAIISFLLARNCIEYTGFGDDPKPCSKGSKEENSSALKDEIEGQDDVKYAH